MLDSYPRSRIATNTAIVKADNIDPIKASVPLYILESTCLILIQEVNKSSLALGNKLIYTIYVINKDNSNVTDISLIDILPSRTRFVSTTIQQGRYTYCEGKIAYSIDNIQAYSLVKIVLTLYPQTYGEKENSIEVTSNKYANHTINNPAKVICTVYKKH
jgi:uncharacterized repeat protein (TIGR01451 family)